jgi:hypothetical protein
MVKNSILAAAKIGASRIYVLSDMVKEFALYAPRLLAGPLVYAYQAVVPTHAADNPTYEFRASSSTAPFTAHFLKKQVIGARSQSYGIVESRASSPHVARDHDAKLTLAVSTPAKFYALRTTSRPAIPTGILTTDLPIFC